MAATYDQLREAGSLAAKSDAFFTVGQLIGNLAWISKIAVKVKGTKSWPAVFEDKGEGPIGERYTLRMAKQIAEWVLKASRIVK